MVPYILEINDGQPCRVGELGKNEPLEGGHGPSQGQQAQGYGPPMSDLSTDPVFLANLTFPNKQICLACQTGSLP